MNKCEQRFFNYGFLCWFQRWVKAELQSDKWRYDKARNLPRRANARTNDGAIVFKRIRSNGATTNSLKRKKTVLVNQHKQHFFLLQFSGRFSTRSVNRWQKLTISVISLTKLYISGSRRRGCTSGRSSTMYKTTENGNATSAGLICLF